MTQASNRTPSLECSSRPPQSGSKTRTTSIPTRLRVSQLPEDCNSYVLKETFEYHSGGEVINVEMDYQTNSAVLEFDTTAALSAVLLGPSIKVGGRKLDIAIYYPNPQHTDTSRAIEIIGLDNSISEERLLLYFENSRRSGGGEVSSIKTDYVKGTAEIVFVDKEAAWRVAYAGSHLMSDIEIKTKFLATSERLSRNVGQHSEEGSKSDEITKNDTSRQTPEEGSKSDEITKIDTSRQTPEEGSKSDEITKNDTSRQTPEEEGSRSDEITKIDTSRQTPETDEKLTDEGDEVGRTVNDSGTVVDPKMPDINDDDIRGKFLEGVRNVAAVSLIIGYPTACSAPHSLVNGFKRLLAVAVETDINFTEAEKEYIKFAVVADGGDSTEESEEESDDDPVFGLFEESNDDPVFGLFDYPECEMALNKYSPKAY